MSHDFHSPQKQTQRQKRVGEQLRQIIAEIFMRGELIALGDFPVTVSAVNISPDLKNATAYVSPLGGGAENEIALINVLEQSVKEVRTLVAKRVNLRYTPHFKFKLDKSFDEAAKISKLLKEAESSKE